jgi:integrase/recombinase XerC
MPDYQLTSQQRFLDHIKFERRLSVHTVRAYMDDLSAFFLFTEQQFEIKAPEMVTSAMVRSWVADLSVRKVQARSINRKLSSLKAFYRFGQKAGMFSSSPLANIPVLRIKKRLPAYIEKDKMEALLHEIEFPDSFQGRTEYLVITLLYHTGIRVSELANLKMSQIDLDRSQIKVLGKGNKERIIPVHEELVALIKAYQQEKNDNFPSATFETLLLTARQKPPGVRQIYDIVHKRLLLVTTAERRSPHVLRHSFATHLTANGAELNAVKELLGHTSLAATQIYTHNSIERLRDIHRKAHPRG